MNSGAKEQSLLTFRVGPVLCCAPSLPVRSIIPPPKLTQPPGSDSSQPGIFKHGSHIVKVLDLRQKFGIEESEQTQPGNLIICIFEKEGVAFWVDQILDVFDFPSEGWGNVPAAIPRGVFTRTLVLNKKIHLYSEFDKLSTIEDLGYLKHYIQQLKQQDEKEIKTDEAKEIKKSKPEIVIDENKITSTSEPIKKESKPLLESAHKAQASSEQPLSQQPSPSSYRSKINENKANISINNKPLPSSVANTDVTPEKTRNNIKQNTSKFKSTVTTKTSETTSPSVSSVAKSQQTTTYETDLKKTEPHSENKEEKIINNEESSSIAIMIFFLFIIAICILGFYYVFSDGSSKDKEQKPVVHTEIIQQPLQQEPPESIPVLLPREAEQFQDNMDELIENESVSKDENIDQTSENEYRADILQQDNEITITIHQPTAENISSVDIEKEIISPLINDVNDGNDVDGVEVIDVEVETNSEKLPVEILKAEKIISEVIHVVVKGDTLWAIAKKYVDDPFLYPELARLSNIKNPHRIYPGNRVRIRFIKN